MASTRDKAVAEYLQTPEGHDRLSESMRPSGIVLSGTTKGLVTPRGEELRQKLVDAGYDPSVLRGSPEALRAALKAIGWKIPS
jgi:hypothetical protein